MSPNLIPSGLPAVRTYGYVLPWFYVAASSLSGQIRDRYRETNIPAHPAIKSFNRFFVVAIVIFFVLCVGLFNNMQVYTVILPKVSCGTKALK